ncbi:hypothetical protein NPX13_g5857 [Xylaria arbuscula]|uniref:Uncharacterized protein n=1 Tax=Xylaria arbuscula TaxID=114810 RepID=A0A9W8NDM5_9PEZI|nr:hypothetical protein NPX13_g5857 [Xylaria arbuscula]
MSDMRTIIKYLPPHVESLRRSPVSVFLYVAPVYHGVRGAVNVGSVGLVDDLGIIQDSRVPGEKILASNEAEGDVPEPGEEDHQYDERCHEEAQGTFGEARDEGVVRLDKRV